MTIEEELATAQRGLAALRLELEEARKQLDEVDDDMSRAYGLAEKERDEARAQVAALREEVKRTPCLACHHLRHEGPTSRCKAEDKTGHQFCDCRANHRLPVLADTAAAAKAHDDQIRAESAARIEVQRAALQEALELLMLCDPNGDRVAAFGDHVAEDAAVKSLCERHGYGAVMDSAARQWRLKANPPGGSHTTGPAVGSVQRGVEMIRAALAKENGT